MSDLELDERALAHANAPRPRTELPPDGGERPGAKKKSRTATYVGVGVLVVGIFLSLGVAAWVWAGRELERATGLDLPEADDLPLELPDGMKTPHAMLFVETTPSGASVYAGDELLGTTPLGVDNPYQPGAKYELRIEKPGYATQRVPAVGGKQLKLDLKLSKGR